jgi:hypothetical protein
MERVELIEDLDVRGFCAQGTVGAGSTILISTAWSQLGESRRTVLAGSLAALSSFCR